MNTDYHEQNLECVTLLKAHPDLFTYEPQNDIYYCRQYDLSIGNKKALQAHIERTCKANDKDKIGKLFNDYKQDDMLAAVYNSNRSRCNIFPAMAAIEGKKILEQEMLLYQQREARMQDKFTAGTVEAQYDNYLSAEESADLAEKEHPIVDADIDIDK